MAEALERAGDEVSLLALFDSPQPSICEDINVDDDALFLCDLVNFANRFSGTDFYIKYEDIADLAPEERFQTALAEARRCGTIPAETPESFIRRLVKVGEANVRVIQSYRPQPLSTTVQFFVPHTKTGIAELSGRTPSSDPDLGWSRDVGQAIELHEVPGDHFTMMIGEGAENIVRQLASHLRTGSERRQPQPAEK
jgi:myxalamid-type polyketide synthase MxaB